MTGFWTRQGIVPNLRWGFVALTLFMIGDGIESGFLSPYLAEHDFGSGQTSLLWSVYGFVVAVAAWLSGALAEAFGPRRVMLAGFGIWVVLEIAFLAALAQENFTFMVISGAPCHVPGAGAGITVRRPVLARAVRGEGCRGRVRSEECCRRGREDARGRRAS